MRPSAALGSLRAQLLRCVCVTVDSANYVMHVTHGCHKLGYLEL